MSRLHLGLSAYYHDSAAALISDEGIVAAAQQERFSRHRHDSGFPRDAVSYCLDAAGVSLDDLASVCYYENPRLKFGRVLSSFGSAGPGAGPTFSKVMHGWWDWKWQALATVDKELKAMDRGQAPKAQGTSHHRAHAASAFFPSPFESAAVLCIDGVGEWQTTSIWHGKGDQLTLVNSVSYPHSLGLLYSAFTQYCGFKVDSGEYKLMGLAPYGKPIFEDIIKTHLIDLKEDGSFALNMKYFSYLRGQNMVDLTFAALFGKPIRDPESDLSQHYCDVAASIQAVTNSAVLGLATAAKRMTGEQNLCMAGGVALNCVSNGVLSRSGVFSELWIQPAAGDAGCALGAALDVSVPRFGRPKPLQAPHGDAMRGSLLGPAYNDSAIERRLRERKFPYDKHSDRELVEAVARIIADGGVVGWFQGGMEFGPRALGARSILGDPRSPEMQRLMNLKIKYRESFRPFAPSVLADKAADWFELHQQSPYMLVVSPVDERVRHELSTDIAHGLGSIGVARSNIPAVTHVDYSARVQTVDSRTNPRYASLIQAFDKLTGCPVLINTSFNVRGEPIVCTPDDAYTCFMRTEMDVLVLGNCLLHRHRQPAYTETSDWRVAIPLD